jgi:hypothetical protein
MNTFKAQVSLSPVDGLLPQAVDGLALVLVAHRDQGAEEDHSSQDGNSEDGV